MSPRRCELRSDEDGQHDQAKASGRADRKVSGTELESNAGACGQAGGERFFGVTMKEPEDEEAERQIEGEGASKVWPKAP